MFKKMFISFTVVALFLSFFPYKTYSLSGLSAQSAVLIEADSLEILYEQNKDEVLSMASTTKVMSAIIAFEHIEKNGDTLIEISEEMVMVEGSSMGLRAGDNVNLSVLIVGMLLPSGNDASNSIALSIGGTLEGFSLMMNKKAQELNMKNTNFVTPSGLDHENHYTTAYDMALLLAHAMKIEFLAEIMGSESMTVEFFSAQKDEVIPVKYSNHNKLLSMYEHTTGGKTGYTKKSGRCLVSAAEKDGVSLIAVTLNDPDDWLDHINMFDYGFSLIKQHVFTQTTTQLKTSEGKTLNVEIFSKTFNYIGEKTFNREIILPRFIYEYGLEKGDKIGSIRYYINDELVLEEKIVY